MKRLGGFRDPKVRSVRIDKGYRGIVIMPEEGNVYFLAKWIKKTRRTDGLNIGSFRVKVIPMR